MIGGELDGALAEMQKPTKISQLNPQRTYARRKNGFLKETRGNGLSAPDKLNHTVTIAQLKTLRNKKQLQRELVIHTNMHVLLSRGPAGTRCSPSGRTEAIPRRDLDSSLDRNKN